MDRDICVVTKLKFQLDILSSPRVSKEERRLKIEIFFEADCSSWIEYTSREPGLRTIREKRKKIGEKAKQGKGGRKERRKEGGARLLWKPGHFLVGLARETLPRSENVEQYLRSSVRKEQTREATSILTSDFVVKRDELVK